MTVTVKNNQRCQGCGKDSAIAYSICAGHPHDTEKIVLCKECTIDLSRKMINEALPKFTYN